MMDNTLQELGVRLLLPKLPAASPAARALLLLSKYTALIPDL